MRILFLIILFFCYGIVFATEIEVVGESVIIDNDVVSAKAMALSRAKWTAIEMASPTKIKIDTIINNSKLADEAVKTEISATIQSYTILEEYEKDNRYVVKLKANVIPEKVNTIINDLSSDTSICVMIAGILPNSNNLLFNQAFSFAVNNQLKEKGFNLDIVDYANISSNAFNVAFNNPVYANIDKILKDVTCRNILLGKLSIIDMGNNVGYGTVSFKIVAGELNWKLLIRQNNKINLLNNGFFKSRASGATLNDAALNTYKSMANNTAVKLVSQVSEKVLGNNYKSIRIVLTGINNTIDDLMILKNDLKNIPFVLQIKEQDDNSFIVDYPDKSYYLGIFLEKANKYKVIKLSDNELIIRK